MKSIGLKVFSFIFALVSTTLACAVPSLDSIFSPLPKDNFSNSDSGWSIGTDSTSSVEYYEGGLHMIIYTPFYVSGVDQVT